MAKTLPITATTQQHLDIEDIVDDLVILKNGGAALILQTTAVNFGLLSETEQDAIIYAYGALLNSLNFPIQIVVRSRRMDISSYLELLKRQEEKQTNENLRFQMKKYRHFVESIIKENRVLDKRFYIVIPFSPLELGVKPATTSLLDLLLPIKKRSSLPFPKDYILQKAKNSLYPKRDHIIRQLARIGLKAQQLTTQQLAELFYDIYNPVQGGGERLNASVSDYTTTLVTPATEEPIEPIEKPKEEKSEIPPTEVGSEVAKVTPPGIVSEAAKQTKQEEEEKTVYKAEENP